MKERYEVPEMEVIEFESEDVIIASGGNNGIIEPEGPYVPAQ